MVQIMAQQCNARVRAFQTSGARFTSVRASLPSPTSGLRRANLLDGVSSHTSSVLPVFKVWVHCHPEAFGQGGQGGGYSSV